MKKNTSKKSNKTFLSKHYPLLIILALLVLLVASVSILVNLRNNAPIESDDDYVTVPGGPDGFYASDQVAFGGDSVSNVSINSVQMTAEEDALCITLDFKEENSSSQASTVLSTVVPLYSVQVLPQPYRLMILMESVSDWTFTAKKSWLDFDLIQGAFVAPPTNSTNDNPAVVFQLSKNVIYRTTEENGVLRIYLKEAPTNDTAQYYALLNGLTNYTSAKLINATPCLCSDAVHVLLISKGFSSAEAAQSYCEEIAETVSNEFPGKSPFIQRLEPGQMPDYPDGLDEDEMASLPIISRDGESYTLPVFMINGIILSADQTSALCAVPYYDVEASSVQYAEQLYEYQIESKAYTPIKNVLFHTILIAAYSPDGNYIAILDFISEDNRTDLYLYDLRNRECRIISEFSDCFIYDFIWDDDSQLYAIIEDNDGVSSLNRIVTSGPKLEITQINQLSSSEGMLAYQQGLLYFSDKQDDDVSRIFALDVSDPESKPVPVTEGSRFYITSDYLVIESRDRIRVFDQEKEKNVEVLPCESLVSVACLNNSDNLILSVSSDDKAELYDLYLFDAHTASFTYLCSSFCNDYHALSDKEIIINSFYSTQNDTVPVAYLFKLNLFDS